jgi:hypothetical protein
MTRKGPKNVGAHLPDAVRNRVGVHLDKISNLLAHWKAQIGEPLASHSYPVSYQGGRLSLRADTSAWASRVRHDHGKIIEQLKRDPFFHDLAELYVRVLPERAAARRQREAQITMQAPSRISANAASLIQSVADGIADPMLRRSLIRLAGAPHKRLQPKR